MKCPRCEYILPEDSEFCQYCGIKLENKSVNGRENIAAHTHVAKKESTYEALQEVSQFPRVHESFSSNNHHYEKRKKQSAVSNNKTSQKNKQRYCKLCGKAVDSFTKKCTGCGKKYFKVKFKFLYAALAALLLFVGYVGINYFGAVSAMNNQEFIKSKQFFDNLLLSESLFSNKYAYVKAGVLFEEGKYIEALNAFNKVHDIPLPVNLERSLKNKIFAAGRTAYRAGDMTEAKKNFEAIRGYGISIDYLLLIQCNDYQESQADYNYNVLIKQLGFEDANEIMLKYEATAKMFLEGRWERFITPSPYYSELNYINYYFELKKTPDGGWRSQYNLPQIGTYGYFYLSDGIYYIGETKSAAVKCFEFSIIDKDKIYVYCYKDGSKHVLNRK